MILKLTKLLWIQIRRLDANMWKNFLFKFMEKAGLLRGNIAGVPAWITWSNVDKVPYFRSVFPSPVRLRCHSFPSSPRRPFNFSLPSQWLHCQSVSFVKTINHTKKEKKKALWGELWLSAGCLSYLKSVSFIFCIAFSLWLDSDDWQSLTDKMFFSPFLHKTYFCIFTLKNLLLSVMQFCYSWVYIYTDIHIFLYPPPFSFDFLCANVQKSTSTQYYRLYNVDSYLFFTFMYELRFL